MHSENERTLFREEVSTRLLPVNDAKTKSMCEQYSLMCARSFHHTT